MIRGIRGAITVKENNANEMVANTKILLDEMIEKNEIVPENVVQVLITATEDLDAVFPARAMRMLDGWTYVPVMCMREIPVVNSLEKCIRIMMTVETDIPQDQIDHIYLEGAVVLRPDLSMNK
ncbi:chorismate mutase [Schinkia azotoformans MEV2011]|uniref:chorismate mutase n=1 Tax=Schinkia azotoformans MEV2011 TaxID=1348973 RepID=A0A072P4Y9_SCHAZ|nr:chorismate mutase [Schinkia azotoformans]KEF40540.1 chorismate mutase [Schinkia azotoformans MEV2011]MEC1696054.1 chorismate mutase [Schinkia azotoformans]MEC1716732.1 chorismate mutase [Schinkia azotoformans]MEC1725442.1 chorismate mutase [Schinkia azotoformans]MEC1739571.1 chorismate mutase [Schinkia azotoformans]